jgi:hypothetical protein
MYRFDENNENRQIPYPPYEQYIDATSTQQPEEDDEYEDDEDDDEEDVYDDDAETEAFLAKKRQAQILPPLFGGSNGQTQTSMPKAESLSVVRKLKGAVIAGSLVAFGILSALVASHTALASASQTPSSSGQDTNSGSNSITPSSGGNFFQQQQGGGYGFGNNGSSGSGSPNGGSGIGQSPSVSSSQAS